MGSNNIESNADPSKAQNGNANGDGSATATTANSQATPSSSSCSSMAMALVVMGPSACGKSEVASGLAARFQCPFLDGDSFHSKENVHKMANGISLTDADRIPWLTTLATEMRKYSDGDTHAPATPDATPRINVVLACSALKKFYRDILRTGSPNQTGIANGHTQEHAPQNSSPMKVVFVFLDCSRSTLEKRIQARKGHFMKVNLLDSQLATLENPCLDGNNDHTATIRVDGDLELAEILDFTANELKCMWNTEFCK